MSELSNTAKHSTEKDKRRLTNIVSGKIIKKYRLLHETGFLSVRQRLHIGRQPVKRKQKQNAMSQQTKYMVCRFYEEDVNSSMTPGKKEFVTKNKTKKKKRVLLDSLKNLHRKFNQTKPNNISISYATFCKLKPFWVVHPQVSDRDTCLCTKHANYQFLIDKLHYHKLLKVKNVSDVSNIVCCSKLSKECMYRECSRCENKALPIETVESKLSEQTFYYQWTPKTEERIDKNGKTINVKLTKKKKIVCDIQQLIAKAQENLASFLKHTFNWWHQFSTLKKLKTSLNANEILVVIEFSENYVCKCNEEVQSAHFGAS
ncbi:uncharacterized protein LOC134527217 [Bacillus rossius redtenbacheri]|uniref:uncharacterized protein LOC134527217 n=1 Tax=Bacillus rossius redtenbacheri TaxID=93214 RepID=UPI002FDECA06